MDIDHPDSPRRRTTDRIGRRLGDLPVEPSPNGKPRRRQIDGWLDRWVATVSDLTRLTTTHPMMDAVIDEQIGRMIRIGDRWLTDFASCNYLGFDLDEEIIAAVPEYLANWGTHPSWSRLLGQPAPLPRDRGAAHRAARHRGLARAPDDHAHPHVGDPGAGRRRHDLPRRAGAQDDLRRGEVAAGHGATVVRFRHNDHDHLEELLAASDPGAPRIIAMDGVNSMTGNAPDMAEFARVAREHDALLYVDDAHGFGVIGERSVRRALRLRQHGQQRDRATCGVDYENVVLVAGFSKSYSSLLAFIACPRASRRRSRCWPPRTSTRDPRRWPRSPRPSPASR